jgi:hypothetical protein
MGRTQFLSSRTPLKASLDNSFKSLKNSRTNDKRNNTEISTKQMPSEVRKVERSETEANEHGRRCAKAQLLQNTDVMNHELINKLRRDKRREIALTWIRI